MYAPGELRHNLILLNKSSKIINYIPEDDQFSRVFHSNMLTL